MYTEKICLGLDEGAGAVKIYGPDGGIELPSITATDGTQATGHIAGLRSRKPPMRVELWEGGEFYVGADAHDFGTPVENLDHSRFSGSPELRALTYGALSMYMKGAGVARATADIIVGLPIESLSGEIAEQTVAGVRKWMVGEHMWTADNHNYTLLVENVKVTSQPVGAFFDYLMDDEGQYIPQRKSAIKKEVGICSIGMNTVELQVIRDRAAVDRFTSGNTLGVRRLLDLINRGDLYSRGELDSQLRAGTLDYKNSLPIWASEVGGFIEDTWGKAWRRFAAVIAVGGGAVLLKDQVLTIFQGKAVVPDSPVMATARGLYKIGYRRGAR